jgi:hypothetical protein
MKPIKPLLITAFALISMALTFDAAAQTKAELQMMHMGILERAGYEGTVDSDGDVRFVHDESTYFIQVDEEDADFFRLVLANIWPIESELERLQVVKAIDAVNAKVKVAKGFIVGDNVWISVEVFHEPGEHEDFLERYVTVIELFVSYYVEEMQE